MPEPLKNLYNQNFISSLCEALEKAYSEFDSNKFTKEVFDNDWNKKELKERMRHISQTLHNFLPKNYKKAIWLLKPVAENFSGFGPIFFSDYVELYGLDDYEESISAMEHFTKYPSSEFAIRRFIIKYPKRTMSQMEKWTQSDNHHVRRLASEGCRPRLPWAISLPEFKRDPKPIIKILQKLKNDESEYVRRSVANNLNDISKDNPQTVIDIAKSWLGQNSKIDCIVKHACRSLLKAGNSQIMEIFGFVKADHVDINKFQIQESVNMGEDFEFLFNLQTNQTKLGKLRIEYAIGFMKKNGKRNRKIFKISESDYPNQNKKIIKNYSFRKISTRKYYAGTHDIAIIINGYELVCKKFQLNL